MLKINRLLRNSGAASARRGLLLSPRALPYTEIMVDEDYNCFICDRDVTKLEDGQCVVEEGTGNLYCTDCWEIHGRKDRCT